LPKKISVEDKRCKGGAVGELETGANGTALSLLPVGISDKR